VHSTHKPIVANVVTNQYLHLEKHKISLVYYVAFWKKNLG